MHEHAKVFGLGLSKTGTSTLAEALSILGIRTLHFPHDEQTLQELERADYRLSVLAHYQGLTDTPVAPYYAQLDRAWPDSKFILTVREKASWLRSAEAHWRVLKGHGRNVQNRSFQTFADFVNTAVYGCTSFQAERFSHVYDLHVRNVRDYFADRPRDLLIYDICGGKAAWPELCAFLDVPVPERAPFPHAYRSSWQSADLAREELHALAPNGETAIVVDYDGLRNYLADSRRVMPFMERHGLYWGLPHDDAEAVREVERQRVDRRAEFFVLGASALWFLDRFAEFGAYLRSRYPCVLANERLHVFDLRN